MTDTTGIPVQHSGSLLKYHRDPNYGITPVNFMSTKINDMITILTIIILFQSNSNVFIIALQKGTWTAIFETYP